MRMIAVLVAVLATVNVATTANAQMSASTRGEMAKMRAQNRPASTPATRSRRSAVTAPSTMSTKAGADEFHQVRLYQPYALTIDVGHASSSTAPSFEGAVFHLHRC